MFGGFSQNPNNRGAQIESTGIKGRANCRRVFNNSMCAHVWAQQTQSDGRSANGNLYFRDAAIFSYDNSWPLAVFVTLPSGSRAVVVNTDRYSNTTSGHLREVEGALRGLGFQTIEINSQITVQRFVRAAEYAHHAGAYAERFATAAAHAAEHRAEEWRNAVAAAQNVRKRVRYGEVIGPDCVNDRITAIDDNWHGLDLFCRTLGTSNPVTRDAMFAAGNRVREVFAAHFTPAAMAKREKAAARRAERAPVENARKAISRCYGPGNGPHSYVSYRDEKRLSAALRVLITSRPESEWRPVLETLQTAIALREINDHDRIRYPDAYKWRPDTKRRGPTPDEWHNGARGQFYQDSPTLVRRNGDVLETSRGADCPWAHAVRIFKMAQHCRATGTGYETNGHTVHAGHFALRCIEPDGTIHVGCHVIRFDEMSRLACREIQGDVAPRFPLPVVITPES